MSKLAERLTTLKSLPALPTTVISLVRSLTGSTSGASDFEDIIKTDAALSAAVLKFANSAAQGLLPGSPGGAVSLGPGSSR